MTPTDTFHEETLPHFQALHAFARRLARSRESADDLVQQTYLQALAAQGRYRSGSNARAWLMRILVNTAFTVHRRARREAALHERYRLEAPALCEPQGPAPSRAMLAALKALPEGYRQVVTLVDLRGLGYTQVAAELDIPLGTVMSRLSRGRAQLRQALDVEAGERTTKRPTRRTRRAA